MGRLSVTFRGSCANYRGVVPGVPHRVVLPDGDALRFGSCKFPGEEPEEWVVPPHLAFICIEAPAGQTQVDCRPFVVDGWIRMPVQIQVVNPTGSEVTYHEGSYNTIPALSDYVYHYQPSTEVVQGGRAMCYFDLTAAHISMRSHGDALQAFAEIETDGDPIIRITPLSIAGEPDHSKDIPLPEETSLLVLNQGLECGNEAEEGNFDFMLQFLTASGGIPGNLKKYPPGWPDDGLSKTDPTACVQELRKRGYPDPATFDVCGLLPTLFVVGVRISCSDSRYP